MAGETPYGVLGFFAAFRVLCGAALRCPLLYCCTESGGGTWQTVFMPRPMREMIGARPIRVGRSGCAIDAVAAALGQYSREDIVEAFSRGDFVSDGEAESLAPESPVRAGETLWAFAPVPDEPVEPIVLDVVAETERYVVVDKPHGLATMPRGSHVAETVTIAARRQFGNPDMVAAHRLDRETAGLVMLTTAHQWRGRYQQMFAKRAVTKTYVAVAPRRNDLEDPMRVELRMDKRHGQMQGRVTEGTPNAITDIQMIGGVKEDGNMSLYRIRPLTGKTHQIRVTMAHLGIPIVGDPLYPRIMSIAEEQERTVPLQLLAESLVFADPFDGDMVRVRSQRSLAFTTGPQS